MADQLSKSRRIRHKRNPDDEQERFVGAPSLTPAAAASVTARLSQAGHHAHRDPRGLIDLGSRVATDTTWRALSACTHYLGTNRLEWWDVEPPQEDIAAQNLHDAFCSPFATVVGGDVDDINIAAAVRRVSWSGTPEFSSPNVVPGIDFSVPFSWQDDFIPLLWTRPVAVGLGAVRANRTVLVNGVGDQYIENDDREQVEVVVVGAPSQHLVLEFAQPQRAVAVEFGIAGDDGDRSNDLTARFTARDVAGNTLGQPVELRYPSVPTNNVNSAIGKAVSQGNIASIELHLPPDGDGRRWPVLIYRIWYERFPPAAVRQGVVRSEFRSGALTEGEVIETLPFHCDRFFVMARGFKIEMLDRSVELKMFQFGVAATPTLLPDGRRGVIVGNACLIWPREPVTDDLSGFDNRVSCFYTLVAWDSSQAELYLAQPSPQFVIEEAQTDSDPVNALPQDLDLPDPCPQGTSSEAARLCGPVLGTIKHVFCESVSGPRIDSILAIASLPERTGSGQIHWRSFYKGIGSDRGLFWGGISGDVVTGPSLVVRETFFAPFGAHAVSFDDLAALPQGEDVFGHPASEDLIADMAFLGLGMFRFQLDGPVWILDVEAKAQMYDGSELTWSGRLGSANAAGGQALPGISWPLFAAIRRPAREAPRMAALPLLPFPNVPIGTVATSPSQYGELRNDGDVPILISAVEKGGVNADEFSFRIEHRGRVFTLAELARTTPLILEPGESLHVGGLFAPRAEGGPIPGAASGSRPPINPRDLTRRRASRIAKGGPPPRSAYVAFDTNHPELRQVFMPAWGETVSTNAKGRLSMSSVDFGDTHVGSRTVRRVHMHSHGTTPLVVKSGTCSGGPFALRLGEATTDTDDPKLPLQLFPGEHLTIDLEFAPKAPGPARGLLELRTNAGEFTLSLMGRAAG